MKRLVRQLKAPIQIGNRIIKKRRDGSSEGETAQEISQVVDAEIHSAIADKCSPTCQRAGKGFFS